ncbi:MAG: glycosyltransferase family 25 protein [Rhizomicrobium sp.]
MQTYVINLARRPDRMSAMTAQLEALQIPYTRIDAVDAKDEHIPDIETRIARTGPLGPIARGDACCSLSHILCWELFVANSTERYALILEDDVTLRRDCLKLFAELARLPEEVDLLKLECYGGASRQILVGKETRILPEFRVAPLHSRHTGSGAYLISRTLAARLLEDKRLWPFTIDHMLFNPDISPMTAVARPYQLIPAIARQIELKTDSDIEEWRIPFRALSWFYIRRELRRTWTGLALLPKQILDVVSGKSRVIQVGLAPE